MPAVVCMYSENRTWSLQALALGLSPCTCNDAFCPLQYQLRPTWPRMWRNRHVGDNRLSLACDATNPRLSDCFPCSAAARDASCPATTPQAHGKQGFIET
ncbi:hypothetical protein M440DRAFT_1194338 [Trichoderma longibrachiatum ATCC 18648]|uniref:Uncharacterized protein n=1 Tax=Trichoderma longibrachiatum ATCC 18648 TaxID=983965 RepID=A0A2T4CAA3_TRILO|nr:hypothetical protein M440DRAFT_1194338 [Trichoderma longibrachiatum ATCC 18648]